MAKLLEKLAEAGLISNAVGFRTRAPGRVGNKPGQGLGRAHPVKRPVPPTVAPKPAPKPAPQASQVSARGLKLDPKGNLVRGQQPRWFYELPQAKQMKLLQQAQRLRKSTKIEAKRRLANITKIRRAHKVRDARNYVSDSILTYRNKLPGLMQKGLGATAAFSALYYALSGNSPSASTPDTQAIATLTPQAVATVNPVVSSLKAIQTLKGYLGEDENSAKVSAILGQLESALAPLTSTPMSLDNPSSVAAFAGSANTAEDAIMAFLDKSEQIGPYLQNYPEWLDLLTGLTQIASDIDAARAVKNEMHPLPGMDELETEASKIDLVLKYSSVYNLRVKRANPAAIWPITMVFEAIRADTVDFNQIKEHLVDIKEVIEGQRTSGFNDLWMAKGFDKYTPMFDQYLGNLKNTIDLINKMVRPPSHQMDRTQIDSISQFISSAQSVLDGSYDVLTALKDIQGGYFDFAGKVQNLGLGLGMDMTPHNSVARDLGQVEGALSQKIKELTELLERARQAEAQGQMVAQQQIAPAASGSAAQQIASIVL